MRKATPDSIAAKRLELARLKQDWPRMNRPYVSKELKGSLFTKMKELESEIQGMEETLNPPKKTKRNQRVGDAAEQNVSET